eukprot:CAMPEP_0184655420 /NCGR_PEP_ID=MMETSP0308-20130426/13031_1 /TAXON_ID=38269 /ORGANISM="Gloeochaete witrockiana, Strain SAG 46.84" /LENGTH=255 /DNA_ID=CAMNT_0027091873 /DNA_START=401 /DNA_END=1166 /DNA_ORIENTATION=+
MDAKIKKFNGAVRANFYFGSDKLGSPLSNFSSLQKECEHHHDVVFLQNVQESYGLLAVKTRRIMEFASGGAPATFCDSNGHVSTSARQQHDICRFYFKTDDNQLVNVGALVSALTHLQKHGSLENTPHRKATTTDNRPALNPLRLYWGDIIVNSTVPVSGKNYDPLWDLGHYTFPWARGHGYVLSMPLIQTILQNSHALRHQKSEDLTVALWVLPYVVYRVHDRRFACLAEECIVRGDFYLTENKKSSSSSSSSS